MALFPKGKHPKLFRLCLLQTDSGLSTGPSLVLPDETPFLLAKDLVSSFAFSAVPLLRINNFSLQKKTLLLPYYFHQTGPVFALYIPLHDLNF